MFHNRKIEHIFYNASLKKVMNSQRCVRAGGKHNDIMEVGLDGSHHTFFEMLGHWAFHQPLTDRTGCAHALHLLIWDFAIPLHHLSFTYFGGNEEAQIPPDHVSKEFWSSLGIEGERITAGGMEDNFWQMADTGPCGPCTEIHYDPHPGQCEPLELWNLVFMQYNRDEKGELTTLPACHMDTGMGLERLCGILNGKTSNYDTDLFIPIMDFIHEQTGAPKYSGLFGPADAEGKDTAYRILADHARMISVTIADGAVPTSSGKGYVLKKILRRAVYYASLLTRLGGTEGKEAQLLSELPDFVATSLGPRFPSSPALSLSQIRPIILNDANQGMNNLRRTRNLFRKAKQHNQLKILEDFHKHNHFGLTDEVVAQIAKQEFYVLQ